MADLLNHKFGQICSSLFKLMSIKSVMPYNHLVLLPSIFPSIRVFSMSRFFPSGGKLPKYWSFSFSISSSKEYSGLISFRIDWLDLRAVQGTLKSLLQHHSSKTSILQHSAFFIVQHSYPYTTTGKTTALTKSFREEEIRQELETRLWMRAASALWSPSQQRRHSSCLADPGPPQASLKWVLLTHKGSPFLSFTLEVLSGIHTPATRPQSTGNTNTFFKA